MVNCVRRQITDELQDELEHYYVGLRWRLHVVPGEEQGEPLDATVVADEHANSCAFLAVGIAHQLTEYWDRFFRRVVQVFQRCGDLCHEFIFLLRCHCLYQPHPCTDGASRGASTATEEKSQFQRDNMESSGMHAVKAEAGVGRGQHRHTEVSGVVTPDSETFTRA